MQAQRHYSKAPITEAVIDLRVNLPEGFTVDRLKDIHSSISEKFPTIEPFYKGVGALLYQPGESFKVDTSEQQIGMPSRKLCKEERPKDTSWRMLRSQWAPL